MRFRHPMTFPTTGLALAAAGYAVVHMLLRIDCWLAVRWASRHPVWVESLHESARLLLVLKLFLLGLTVVGYAFYRAAYLHPLLATGYRRWLSLMPWTAGRSLPLRGALGPAWYDAAVLSVVLLVGWYDLRTVPQVWLLLALVPYALVLLTVVVQGRRGPAHPALAAVMLGWPLAIYPWFDARVAVVVMVVIVGLLLWAQRQRLQQWPWDFPEYLLPTWEELIGRSSGRGGTYRALGPVVEPPYLAAQPELRRLTRPAVGLMVAALLAWYTHAILHALVAAVPDGDFWPQVVNGMAWTRAGGRAVPSGPLWVVVAVGAVSLRLTLYVVQGGAVCLPPISLWGRLWTGRPIVVGYDRIFVAPLLASVAAVVVPRLLLDWSLPLDWIPTLSVFAFVATLVAVGPGRQEWFLLGQHRLQILSIQTDPRGQVTIGKVPERRRMS